MELPASSTGLPSTAGQKSAPNPPSGVPLTPGQIVSARVLEALGADTYLLALRGRTLVANSPTPLTPDTIVQLAVQAAEDPASPVPVKLLAAALLQAAVLPAKSSPGQTPAATSESRVAAMIAELELPSGPATSLTVAAFMRLGVPLADPRLSNQARPSVPLRQVINLVQAAFNDASDGANDGASDGASESSLTVSNDASETHPSAARDPRSASPMVSQVVVTSSTPRTPAEHSSGLRATASTVASPPTTEQVIATSHTPETFAPLTSGASTHAAAELKPTADSGVRRELPSALASPVSSKPTAGLPGPAAPGALTNQSRPPAANLVSLPVLTIQARLTLTAQGVVTFTTPGTPGATPGAPQAQPVPPRNATIPEHVPLTRSAPAAWSASVAPTHAALVAPAAGQLREGTSPSAATPVSVPTRLPVQAEVLAPTRTPSSVAQSALTLGATPAPNPTALPELPVRRTTAAAIPTIPGVILERPSPEPIRSPSASRSFPQSASASPTIASTVTRVQVTASPAELAIAGARLARASLPVTAATVAIALRATTAQPSAEAQRLPPSLPQNLARDLPPSLAQAIDPAASTTSAAIRTTLQLAGIVPAGVDSDPTQTLLQQVIRIAVAASSAAAPAAAPPEGKSSSLETPKQALAPEVTPHLTSPATAGKQLETPLENAFAAQTSQPNNEPERANDVAMAAVRDVAAEHLLPPAHLDDYDRVIPLPMMQAGQPVPARLAVTTRRTASGGTACWMRVDCSLSHLGAVSVRLSGADGGPVAVTLIAAPAAAAVLANALPALTDDLHAKGVVAALRVVAHDGDLTEVA